MVNSSQWVNSFLAYQKKKKTKWNGIVPLPLKIKNYPNTLSLTTELSEKFGRERKRELEIVRGREREIEIETDREIEIETERECI